MRLRSPFGSVYVAFAVTLLTTASAFADPAKLAPGDPFPILETDSVSGTHVVLPADGRGAPFVAIFAFSQKAGEASAQWSHALYKALPAATAIYAVADLSHVPALFRGFAIGGIKKEPRRRSRSIATTCCCSPVRTTGRRSSRAVRTTMR